MSLDVYLEAKDGGCLYEANITHNLNTMAEEAGIYKHLWRPDEIGVTAASELIEPLRAGLHQLVERPSHFKQFDSPNGWGLYIHFVPFVSRYFEACVNNPSALVRVSR